MFCFPHPIEEWTGLFWKITISQEHSVFIHNIKCQWLALATTRHFLKDLKYLYNKQFY